MKDINDISGIIVDKAMNVHRGFGPGLLESVYEQLLYLELINAGLDVVRQKPICIHWKGVRIEHAFQADLIVEQQVLIELKSVQKLSGVHFKQTLTYLRLSGLKLGLLINFNEELLKTGIHRLVNRL